MLGICLADLSSGNRSLVPTTNPDVEGKIPSHSGLSDPRPNCSWRIKKDMNRGSLEAKYNLAFPVSPSMLGSAALEIKGISKESS